MTEPLSPCEEVSVSVLLPVYNAREYLAEAIESILSQTFTDFELLVIDDGSTDGSGEIVTRYADRDPRIRFVARENRGLVATLNELAAMARGKYLARMDADDISLPERFRRQVDQLNANPDLCALGTYWLCIDEDGSPIYISRPPLEHNEIDDGNLRGTVSLNHPTVMMRADCLRAVGGYDATYESAEDLDLWLKIAEMGSLANLSDVLLRYRVIDTSVSGTNQQKQIDKIKDACSAAWSRRGISAREIETRSWRPGTDSKSRREFAISWGWRAWKAGNRTTARKYFLKALRISPLSLDAWKALIFGTLRVSRPSKNI